MQALLGLVIFCAIGWACSLARDAVRWCPVVLGITLQFVLAGPRIYMPWMRPLFDALNRAVNAVQAATTAGTPSSSDIEQPVGLRRNWLRREESGPKTRSFALNSSTIRLE